MSDHILELGGERTILSVRALQALDRPLHVAPQLRLVDCCQLSMIQHHAPADHHAVDRGTAFGEDDLADDVAERHVVDVRQIEEGDVGLAPPTSSPWVPSSSAIAAAGKFPNDLRWPAMETTTSPPR